MTTHVQNISESIFLSDDPDKNMHHTATTENPIFQGVVTREINLGRSVADFIRFSEIINSNKTTMVTVSEIWGITDFANLIEMVGAVVDIQNVVMTFKVKQYRDGQIINTFSSIIGPPLAGLPSDDDDDFDDCGYIEYPTTTEIYCDDFPAHGTITLTSTADFGNNLNFNLNTIANQTLNGYFRLYGKYNRVEIHIYRLIVKSDAEKSTLLAFFKDAYAHPITIKTHYRDGLIADYLLATPILEFKEIMLGDCPIYEVELNMVRV